MKHLDSIAVQITLSVIFVIVSSYTAGRMHQWYRHSFERDVAYREGYNQASRSLFHLAVRNMPAKDRAAAAPADRVGVPDQRREWSQRSGSR